MEKIRKTICILVALLVGFQVYACKESRNNITETIPEQTKTMKLKITIGDQKATAILYDNPTSRDFATMLPLTVEMEDYAGTEKIFYPSRKLSTESAPKGFKPSEGDITLYAPWGNIALFYKGFSYSNGLISMGKITSGIEYFKEKGKITVTFELDE